MNGVETTPIANITLNLSEHMIDEDVKVFGGLVECPDNLLDIKNDIFMKIHEAVILKTGPIQQFEGNELLGFKLYIEENHQRRRVVLH